MTKPLHEILREALCCPAPELRASVGADAITDSENDVEVVVVDEARDLAVSLSLNYPEFPDGCRRVGLAFLEDVLKVLVDRPNVLLEQLGEEALREPHGAAVKAHLDAASPVLALGEDDLGG